MNIIGLSISQWLPCPLANWLGWQILLNLAKSTQHMPEPIRGDNAFDIFIFTKCLVDNVKILEQLGSSDHIQIHFEYITSESKKKLPQG